MSHVSRAVLVLLLGLATRAVGAPVAHVSTVAMRGAEIPIGRRPVRITVHPDGRTVWVVDAATRTLSLTDPTSDGPAARVPLPGRPVGVTVDTAGTRLYVACRHPSTIAVVDTRTAAVVAVLPGGRATVRALVAANVGTTLLVDDFGDSPDAHCPSDVGQHTCTLRAALPTPPCPSAPVTVNVPAGAHIMLSQASALTVLCDNTTIQRDGAGPEPILDAGGSPPDTRVFDIGMSSTGPGNSYPRVTLSHLVVTGGHLTGNGEDGAGIRSYGITTLANVIVRDNTNLQAKGGGIANVDGNLVHQDVGMMTITDSAIVHNGTAMKTERGGGIVNAGTLLVRNSTIAYNVAQGGGGICNGVNSNTSHAQLAIENSTFIANTAGSVGGGALLNQMPSAGLGRSTTEVFNATFTGNVAPAGHARGIENSGGSVKVANSILAESTAAATGQDCAGNVDSLGYDSISSTTVCTWSPGMHDLATGILADDLTAVPPEPQCATFPLCVVTPLMDSPVRAANDLGTRAPEDIPFLDCVGSPMSPPCSQCPSPDELGTARLTGSCDLGAVQVTNVPPTSSSTTTTSTTTTPSSTVSGSTSSTSTSSSSTVTQTTSPSSTSSTTAPTTTTTTSTVHATSTSSSTLTSTSTSSTATSSSSTSSTVHSTSSTVPPTSTTIALPGPMCGDGRVDPGEECDLGAARNGVPDTCCRSDCRLRPATYVCRKSGTTCLQDALCSSGDGECSANAAAPADTPCLSANPCTAGDHCQDGNCVPGDTVLCDARLVSKQPIKIRCRGIAFVSRASCSAVGRVKVAGAVATRADAAVPQAAKLLRKCVPDPDGFATYCRTSKKYLHGRGIDTVTLPCKATPCGSELNTRRRKGKPQIAPPASLEITVTLDGVRTDHSPAPSTVMLHIE